jgi:hypothetical protein
LSKNTLAEFNDKPLRARRSFQFANVDGNCRYLRRADQSPLLVWPIGAANLSVALASVNGCRKENLNSLFNASQPTPSAESSLPFSTAHADVATH